MQQNNKKKYIRPLIKKQTTKKTPKVKYKKRKEIKQQHRTKNYKDRRAKETERQKRGKEQKRKRSADVRSQC